MRQATTATSRKRPLVYQGKVCRCTADFEMRAREQGYTVIAGIDEVGRGALCGPVIAGAVILGDGFDTMGLDDSKRLTARQRTSLAEHVRRECRGFALGRAEADEVDTLGIVAATHWAMRRAVAGLALRPEFLLVDGAPIRDAGIPQWAIVKGDARSVSIAAASIVAKVARDLMMQELDDRFPGYDLARNKGYGTELHRKALLRLGPSPCHRRSFGASQMRLFERPD